MDIQTLLEKVEENDFTFEFTEINELFSQPISLEDADAEELEIVVSEIREKLVAEGDYDKVEIFAKTLETHQPAIMEEVGKYFNQDLVEHFCSTGDFEKAEYYFEPFIKDPLNDLDFYISAFKSLLFYQRNTILLRAIEENYEEIRESEALDGNSLAIFDIIIYFIETQAVYENSEASFDHDRLKEKLEPYNLDLSADILESYTLGFNGDIPPVQDLMTRFKNDQNALLLLLRNIFMKRMLAMGLPFSLSGLLFDLTRNYWDEKLPKSGKGHWKNYFKINHKTFERYLINLGADNSSDNRVELIACAWGVAYVYDFLKDTAIINAEQYAEFQTFYKRLVFDIMGYNLDSLSDVSYVMQWPKSDAFTQQEWDGQQAIFKKSLVYEHDGSIAIADLIEEDLEELGAYKINVLKCYKEKILEEVKLLKMMVSLEKAALDYEDDEFDDEFDDYDEFDDGDEFEDTDEEDYNIFGPDDTDFEDAEIVNENFIPSDTPYHAEAKPGRNEPCSCGSGKKYKKCCGKAN